MMYEVRSLYQNRINSIPLLDEECSVAKTEITDDKAAQYMNLLESMGYKRHENTSSVFYTKRSDDRHSEEVIFYK